MTGTGQYLASVGELALVVATVGFGAAALRRALLPAWSGAPALMAGAVLGIAQVVVMAELLGVLHLLYEAPFVAGCLVMGIGLAFGSGRLQAPAEAAPTVGKTTLLAVFAALAIAGALVVRWAIGTEESLHGGMTGFDTMWYHGPFAAGFAQQHSVTAIHFTGAFGPLVWFFPQNSELLHAGGILIFGNDFLSPLINLGWLGLALLAAWCLGRPSGTAPLTLIAAAVVLGSGPWLESQPGNSYNDVAALALLVSTLAILINGRALADRRTGGSWQVLTVAGVAAGIAVGTKVTVLAPLGVLTIGLIALAPVGWRRRNAVAWLAPLLGLGSFWYLRNLFLVGNPLPAVKLPFFPAPQLPSAHSDFAVAHYLGDGDIWRSFFLPGLHGAFGIAWPVVLLGAAGGAVLAVWKGKTPLVRVLGAATIVAALAYVLTPYGAQGVEGHPRNFESNLRYAAPALVVGMALLASAPALGAPRRRLGVLALLVVLFVVVAAPLDARHGPYLKAALAIAALLVLVPFVLARRSGRRLGVPALAGGLAVVGAVVLVAGHRQDRVYIDGRYASPSGIAANAQLDAAFTWARDVRGARIGTDAFRQYGLYGTDLSNRVAFVGAEGAHGSFLPITNCPKWRRALNAGGYQYVVTAPTFRNGAQEVLASPTLEWTRSDPAARRVPHAGPVVFRVTGPFDPAACPRPGD